MGWPKKNEGFRLYFERKAKSYLLVDPDAVISGSNNCECIGEVLIQNDPERPCTASSSVSPMYLYKKCRRASWSEMPEIWQRALAEWMTGKPEDHRGLWRMKELVSKT